MKLALLSIFLALPGFGQNGTFPCKGSFLGSVNMRALIGGATTLYQVDIVCQNRWMTPSTPITGAMINLAMPTVNTIPANVAGVLLTKVYNNQPGQRAQRDLTLGLGAFGMIVGSSALKGALTSGTVGLIVGSVVGVIEYVLPFLIKNEPTLNLSNQCDGYTGMVVPSMSTFECTEYVAQPKKGIVLPSVITFDLMSSWTPGPPPPVPPVDLRRPPVAPPQFHGVARTPTCGEVSKSWVLAHPTDKDPCYVDIHPPGYWDHKEPTILLAKGTK